MNLNNYRPKIVSVGMMILLLNGCSVLLPAIVIGTNEMNKQQARFAFQEAEHLDAGTPVSIELKDGSWVHGELISVDYTAEAGSMSVRISQEIRTIEADEVAQVRVQPKRYSLLPAVFLGVGIDAAILLILIFGNHTLPASFGI